MRPEARLLLAVACIAIAGCSLTNRLTFVRPNADRGEATQVAPVYDFSNKGGRKSASEPQLIAAAQSQYRQGRLPEAQASAARALKLAPSSADANAMMAMVLDARGSAREAGGYYQKAVTLAPSSGIHANNYGTWLCANGRPGESLAWFERALADPDYPTPVAALANAGKCASRAGQADAAEASWRRALDIEPVNIAALAGMAKLEYSRGRHLEARAFAERWLAVAPMDPQGLQLASQIEMKLGDTAASARYLHRLQALPAGAVKVPRSQ